MAALHNKGVLAAAGTDVGYLIEWLGECYHDFEIAGGKGRLTSDGGYLIHYTVIREEGLQIVLTDVHVYLM